MTATDLTRRREVVRPGMCGHNSLFVGQIGDWTWDAVTKACGIDVLTARDGSGAPTYLSFFYYHLRGSRRFHLRSPAFGDHLSVTSRVFGFGSESVLTLHRISRDRPTHQDLEPGDFFTFDDPQTLYVQNFNRWVARGVEHSNDSLVRSSPVGFRHRHLPGLPDLWSPRRVCQRARTEESFLGDESRQRVGEPVDIIYEVDPSRDLNGAGLLYFASYFSIVDWVLLRLWRRLGRSDQTFLDRVVVDQQMLFLGNADAGCVITARIARWNLPEKCCEAIDVVLREQPTGRLLAVCTLELARQEPLAGSGPSLALGSSRELARPEPLEGEEPRP
jgi:probable biosynthetic protein (TIGR04098 family)